MKKKVLVKPYKRMDCGHYAKDQFIHMDGCAKCMRLKHKRESKDRRNERCSSCR